MAVCDCVQAESGAKLAATGAAVMCTQAPAYRSAAAARVHYTREHVADLIRQVTTSSICKGARDVADDECTRAVD